MLGAAQRLRRRSEFAAAVRGGRRGSRGVLVVHLSRPADEASNEPVCAGDTLPPARAGFVVPKAVGGAVVRNRVRRRLRHLVRDRLVVLPPGTDLVVRALPGAGERGYTELGGDLDGAIEAAVRGGRRGTGRGTRTTRPYAEVVPAPASRGAGRATSRVTEEPR